MTTSADHPTSIEPTDNARDEESRTRRRLG